MIHSPSSCDARNLARHKKRRESRILYPCTELITVCHWTLAVKSVQDRDPIDRCLAGVQSFQRMQCATARRFRSRSLRLRRHCVACKPKQLRQYLELTGFVVSDEARFLLVPAQHVLQELHLWKMPSTRTPNSFASNYDNMIASSRGTSSSLPSTTKTWHPHMAAGS